MKKGIWHQMGDRSQRFIIEELDLGMGVGIIISSRDLSYKGAISYANYYKNYNIEILLDQQFYIPEFTNKRIASYPTCHHRMPISKICKISDSSLSELSFELAEINKKLQTNAIIAPAVTYIPNNREIIELNSRLFLSARSAANSLGIPCYGTVFFDKSASITRRDMIELLSSVTSLDADGWYFGFEFNSDRIPSNVDEINNFALASLSLACTGKPVLHAFAGPMALLSPSFGFSASGVGHFQNTWRFVPDRWKQISGQGGGGDAPPRFFSTALWGTIIYPDEVIRLRPDIRESVLTYSPFSEQLRTSPRISWTRWEANKHLVYLISKICQPIFQLDRYQLAIDEARKILLHSIELHTEIHNQGVDLSDNTDIYQQNWVNVLNTIVDQNRDQYEYLELLK